MGSKWTSCDEALPERELAVLVALTSGLVTVAHRGIKNGRNTWELYGPISDIYDLSKEQVTHWMVLPPSPNGE